MQRASATLPPASDADSTPVAADAPPRWFAAAATPRFAIPLLLAAGALLYVVNLGGYPLYTKGEPREAVTVFDIVHNGRWILPMRAGVELPTKPPLMHWLAALLSLAAGAVNETTVRLPSALLAIAALVACYLYVRRLFDERSGLLAALILGTTIQYLQAATGTRVDITLTFFMEIAFFEFLMIAEGPRRRWPLLYLAIAAAALSKGPVGLVLPGAVGLIWMAYERRFDVMRRMGLIPGTVVIAAIAGGWYVAAARVGGVAFVRTQLIGENLVRFLGGPSFHEGHAHPFYYVELALLAGFVPWTALLPAPAVRFARRRDPLGPRLRYLLIWFFTVLVFYSLARSKRGVYLLALYPALAAIVAVSLSDAFAPRGIAPRWRNALAIAGGVSLAVAGMAGLGALVTMRAHPAAFAAILARFDITASGFVAALTRAISAWRAIAVALPLMMLALGVWLIAARLSLEATLVSLAAGVGCVALVANLFVVPAIAETLSLKPFAIAAMALVGDRPVAYLEALNYDVVFYSRRTIPIVHFRDIKNVDYLLCWRDTYDRISPAARAHLPVVLTSGPTDLDGSGGMVLLRRTDK